MHYLLQCPFNKVHFPMQFLLTVFWDITIYTIIKGTLRRRLSHGYFSFIAKYTSSWLMSHRSNSQIITFKGAEPNFLAWRGEIWSMLWNLIQLLIATHHFMYYVSSFPLTQVWIYIHDIKFSNLLILSYIVASKKSTKMFYYCSITSFSRNSMLPSLPISM